MSTSTNVLTSTTASLKSPSWTDLSRDTIPPHLLEWQNQMRDSFFGLTTPLNLTLFLLTMYALYRLLSYQTEVGVTLPNTPAPIVFQTFTPRTLLPFNGTKSASNPDGKVYLAVKGKVHDVTAGRNFYGPGGPYENFAGRDATRGLACQSFEEDMLTKNLDGPLDPCEDLTAEQVQNLEGWSERFDEKYLVVGKLVAFSSSVFH